MTGRLLRLFVADNETTERYVKSSIAIVWMILLLLMGVGVWFFMNADSKRKGNGSIEQLKEVVRSAKEKPTKKESPRVDQIVGSVVENEQLIRKINPSLGRLTESVLNLKLGADETAEVFADAVELRDVVEVNFSDRVEAGATKLTVVPGDLVAKKKSDLESGVWNLLVAQFEFFEHAKFYAIKVSRDQSSANEFATETGFEAVGYSTKGTWISVKAKGTFHWKLISTAWKLTKWDFDFFDVSEVKERQFDVVTGDCLDASDLAVASMSAHRRQFINALMQGGAAFANEKAAKYFRHIPSGQHPAVCIVDINGDGWDDFYLIQQWRKNLLFINKGDSTFREAAAEYGLDIDSYGTSGAFADFDNDGDQDLFLGRSLERSLYFENDQGKFVDRTAGQFDFPLPYLASSVSVTDYNNDGLLDIYVSTYGFPSGHVSVGNWTSEFLDPQHAAQVVQLSRKPNRSRYLDALGPPNVLLKNCGDHFEVSPASKGLELFANSLQATWSDYDGDGDADVYVCNDFARDFLFRNDGNESFRDVTLEEGDSTMMGLGMGASWGDFDQDGRQDLYVSNMYSKAGLRIIENFDTLDGGYRRSADGNRLYLNRGKKMNLVSANAGPGLAVHKAGWSWGGQFVDVNNDGLLDIYVSSGYFSAPEIFSSGKDL